MSDEEQKWPDTIWVVRHGESAANVARAAADASGDPHIGLATRDVDVALSDRGERQAQALGKWFGNLPVNERPTAILVSPYARAVQTATLLRQTAGLDRPDVSFALDERLREKEFGVLDGLTKAGIIARYPEQFELRKVLGKFYHRPPGGESWSDVILRLRSMLDTITREYRRERLLIVCHSVVVLCFHYLFARLTEEEILALDRDSEVANCSVTHYRFDPKQGKQGKLVLRNFNLVTPLEREDTAITSAPDTKLVP
jgi:broad specificity phosphatase PhoE